MTKYCYFRNLRPSSWFFELVHTTEEIVVEIYCNIIDTYRVGNIGTNRSCQSILVLPLSYARYKEILSGRYLSYRYLQTEGLLTDSIIQTTHNSWSVMTKLLWQLLLKQRLDDCYCVNRWLLQPEFLILTFLVYCIFFLFYYFLSISKVLLRVNHLHCRVD